MRTRLPRKLYCCFFPRAHDATRLHRRYGRTSTGSSARFLFLVRKNGHPRYIQLNSSAIELLKSVPRTNGNPYTFPAPTTGRPMPNLFFPWDRIRTRAGLQDFRLHDLRHSFASFIINSRADLYEVQRLLGHSNPRSTQRYAHLSREKLAQAAEVMASITNIDRTGH